MSDRYLVVNEIKMTNNHLRKISCTTLHNNPSNYCQEMLLQTMNVNLIGVMEEIWVDHWDHMWLYIW